MAREREHLDKAPAREALVNIRFEPPVSLEVVRAFIDSVRGDFERESELREASVDLGGEAGAASASQRVVGWRLDCDRTHYVLMCHVNSFTLSRLSPYGRWQELRAEAFKWWKPFCATTGPRRATRLAVRYINAIELPMPVTDFADYLTCPPNVPPELPQGVIGFLHRMVIPSEQDNCVMAVTQALEAPPGARDGSPSITVLLDIDVFRIVNVPCSDDDQLWSGLDHLRVVKNRAFFSHLTERTVEMLE